MRVLPVGMKCKTVDPTKELPESSDDIKRHNLGMFLEPEFGNSALVIDQELQKKSDPNWAPNFPSWIHFVIVNESGIVVGYFTSDEDVFEEDNTYHMVVLNRTWANPEVTSVVEETISVDDGTKHLHYKPAQAFYDSLAEYDRVRSKN